MSSVGVMRSHPSVRFSWPPIASTVTGTGGGLHRTVVVVVGAAVVVVGAAVVVVGIGTVLVVPRPAAATLSIEPSWADGPAGAVPPGPPEPVVASSAARSPTVAQPLREATTASSTGHASAPPPRRVLVVMGLPLSLPPATDGGRLSWRQRPPDPVLFAAGQEFLRRPALR